MTCLPCLRCTKSRSGSAYRISYFWIIVSRMKFHVEYKNEPIFFFFIRCYYMENPRQPKLTRTKSQMSFQQLKRHQNNKYMKWHDCKYARPNSGHFNPFQEHDKHLLVRLRCTDAQIYIIKISIGFRLYFLCHCYFWFTCTKSLALPKSNKSVFEFVCNCG